MLDAEITFELWDTAATADDYVEAVLLSEGSASDAYLDRCIDLALLLLSRPMTADAALRSGRATLRQVSA